MRITKVETIPLRIPFDYGGPRSGWGGRSWTALETLLVRIETEDGLVGWGDAFAYNCLAAVRAAFDDMVAPLILGRDAADIAGLMYELQQALHLFGRYGITLFALSGLDIALWDLAGKRAGLPLAQLLGGFVRATVPAYASLLKYRDPQIVAERTTAARKEGYGAIKLHETEEAEVRAAREAVGEGVPIMLDTNCPWRPVEALARAKRLKPYDLFWLEEPIFPPENFRALAELQERIGIPIAAGENACTAYQFHEMFREKAVTYAQPSVTKLGGISEFRKVAVLAEIANVALMPHSPYFGPGFLATLQLAAAHPPEMLVERFYLRSEASLYGDLITPVSGRFAVPTGPGLGCEPDPGVIAAYRVRDEAQYQRPLV